MPDKEEPRMGRLVGMIALYTVLGIPLVAFLWETLNRVMAGYFDPVRIGLSIPVLILFMVLLRFTARAAYRISA
jgi:hypothetical protein